MSFRDFFTSGESLLSYENIAYSLRFMIDLKVSRPGIFKKAPC